MSARDRFEPTLVIKQPLEASGYISRAHSVIWMCVGVLQISVDGGGKRRIDGAAYGTGLPTLEDVDLARRSWKLLLQPDFQHPTLSDGPATGFAVAQLVGGGFAGWIDRDLRLTSAEPDTSA